MSSRLSSTLLAALVVFPSLGPVASASIDPAYDQLLRTGVSALQRGDAEIAAKYLRLAVFGFLDEPARATEGLVHLALAQAEIPESEAGLRSAVERILYLEEEFAGYREASLDAATRNAFERVLASEVPAESFLHLDAFREAGRRSLLAEMEALSVEAAVERLDALSEQEPDVALWPREAARRLVSSERFTEAAARLAPRAQHSGFTVEDRCLLAQAASAGGRCGQAAEHLELCPTTPSSPDLAAAMIGCEIESGAHERAEARLAALGPVRRDRRFRKLDRELDKALNRARRAAETPPSVAPSPDSAPPAPSEAPAQAAPEQAEAPPDEEENASVSEATPRPLPNARAAGIDEAELSALRELLDARTRESLQEARERIAALSAGAAADARTQLIAGEAAYLLRDWSAAVRHFDRGEAAEPSVPAELRFYFAVALYENGAPTRAAEVLRSCLADLRESAFVRSYRERILGQP